MPEQWNMDDGTFHLGINMAGAVSAGAYTAGVLDFLTEALEQWYEAKNAKDAPVPMHDVSIDSFSGASAGGMCAAISAVMLQGSIEHIHDSSKTDTANRFYEGWVNQIDIEHLLGTDDLDDGGEVISLLDSTIIDAIADYALLPVENPVRPPYLSESLTLFLTLTNVRGVPFSLNGNAPGSAEEEMAYYADLLHFETVKAGDAPKFASAVPLPLGANGDGWGLLKDAAKATGAFPIFLAPRRIKRKAGDYFNSPWESMASGQADRVKPFWPLKESDVFETLNIDGGMTDNDPFQLAHDFLAIRNPVATRDAMTGELHNPPDADKANCAVLTVAPFPANDSFKSNFDFDGNSAVLGMLPNLFTVLISQSRFQGETLEAVVSGDSFSRFVLAPSNPDDAKHAALQCSLLGAFGGFFERKFRAHDYRLGRRNCQKFLKDCFRLSQSNPIIKAGLDKLDAASRDAAVKAFDPEGKGTLPVIPLCGSAVAEVVQPARATITQARVDQIVAWVVARMHAVAKRMIEKAISGPQGLAAHQGADIIISTIGKAKVKSYLQNALSDVIAG
jgi:Patatin-like phospholipase